MTGSASLTVVRAPVLTVSVEPSTLTIASGQSRPFTVTVTDANHVIVTDRDVTWTSSNGLVATVSANGTVTALTPGAATITATIEGKSAAAQVTVTGAAVGSVTVQPASPSLTAGQTTTLTATVTDANGTVVTDRVVTWSSSNNAVATVSATGVVTAIAAGTAVIAAMTSEGKGGSATITVTPLPVGSVAIEPTSVTLLPGASTTLTATVRDAAGTVVTDRPVTWTSSNVLVATVSTTGVVSALAPGSATISATSEAKSGGATVNVIAIPVGSVTVAPSTKSLVVGAATTLSATVKDANGVIVTDRPVAWSSNNTAAATVDPSTGVVTAVAAGSATIAATSGGKSGTSAITVTAAPVASVSLPATMTLVAGQTATLTPTVRDANGTVVTDRIVTWGSSNTAVATVSTGGVVNARSTGTATITATSETKSGSTSVTVTPAPVGSVSVLPSAATRVSGQTVQLAATVKDVTGAVVTDRTVSWSTNDPLVATVSASGLVSTLAVGTATITATSETKSGASAVTVTPGPAAVVIVTPGAVTVSTTKSVQLTASATDARGNPITGGAFTWQSSDTRIATVTTTGLVKGVKAGSVFITATLDGKRDSATVTVSP
jgi:uncharacterized protein YjdB